MIRNRVHAAHRTISAAFLLLPFVLASESAAQPVGPVTARPAPNEYRLTFVGRIDGSEVIEISETHAWWSHRNWGWPPHAVWLGDVQWNPKHMRFLENTGPTRYLPPGVDFSRARLANVRVRDKVTLEPGPRSVRVHLVDTPNGAGHYEFDIVFPVRFRRTVVDITVDIDGSDTLTLTRKGAQWAHHHWAWPHRVLIDDVTWNPRESPQLKAKQWSLPKGVDLSTARLTVHKARDAVVMESFKDRIIIHFADNPLGRSTCELTIDWPLPPAAKHDDPPPPEKVSVEGKYRFRLVQGDPAVRKRGANRLILERVVSSGTSFEIKGPHNINVSGKLWSDKAGGLFFKGTVNHGNGSSFFDSMIKSGVPLRSGGGAFSGVIIPYFVEFSRIPDDTDR